MTLIIGIRCNDGIVMGADGAATLGNLGQQTIKQPLKNKLQRIQSKIIVGVAGPVGLSQRIGAEISEMLTEGVFEHELEHRAMVDLRKRLFEKHIALELNAASISKNLVGNQIAGAGAICNTLVALPLGTKASLIQFDYQCSPEAASQDLPFMSIGSGQVLADPFLAFLKRIFWEEKQPNIADGVFVTYWTLLHAIRTNPGGVAEPIQIVTLRRNIEKKWITEELEEKQLEEHRQNIEAAEKHLSGYGLLKSDVREVIPEPKE